MPLRAATGATHSTSHRPVTPELDKETSSIASGCASGTAGFLACPITPKLQGTGNELALGDKDSVVH